MKKQDRTTFTNTDLDPFHSETPSMPPSASMNLEQAIAYIEELEKLLQDNSKLCLLNYAAREIAHYFSTPISIILLASNQISERLIPLIPVEEQEKYHKLVSKIDTAADKITLAINEIREQHPGSFLSKRSPEHSLSQAILNTVEQLHDSDTSSSTRTFSLNLDPAIKVSFHKPALEIFLYQAASSLLNLQGTQSPLSNKIFVQSKSIETDIYKLQMTMIGTNLSEQELQSFFNIFNNKIVSNSVGLNYVVSFCKLNQIGMEIENTELGLCLSFTWQKEDVQDEVQ